MTGIQTSANNSTPPCYSKNIWYSAIICRLNSGLIFDSNSGWIPIFQTNTSNICRVEPNYLCFWPFMGHIQIITRLWGHEYKVILPDSSKNSTFILKNLTNNSVFESVFDSIFASESSNSGLIRQIYDSTSPQLRTWPCDIRLDNKYRVGPCYAKICRDSNTKGSIFNFVCQIGELSIKICLIKKT